MIRLIPNTGRAVEFTMEQAESIPYVMDAYENIGNDRELEVPFATDQQLWTLKRVLAGRPTRKEGPSSFLPRFGMMRMGDTLVRTPPFTRMYWDSYYDAVFKLLDEDQITDLILVCHSMAIWDLRKGAMYLLLYKFLNHRMTFDRFFTEAHADLKEILYREYTEALTNAKDSDYYDHQDSSHWD